MKSNTIILLTNASMTGTSEIDSSPIELDQMYGYAVQAVWTGTPNGILKLQGSCDEPGLNNQVSNGGPDLVTHWTDVDSPQSISGSPGNYMWNINGAFYRYFRLVYINSSSTGSLSAKAFLKGV